MTVVLSMSELRAERRGLGELLVPERAVDPPAPARRLLMEDAAAHPAAP